MRNYSSLVPIPPNTFRIIDSQSVYLVRKNMKNDMIIFESNFFKRMSEESILSVRKKDRKIKEVFICCNSQNGCRCRFILYEDNSGGLLGDHHPVSVHLHNIYRERQYLFKCHVIDSFLVSPNISPLVIITNYLKTNAIDCYSPDRNFMNSTISDQKRKNLGVIHQKVSEIDIEKLQQLAPGFHIIEISYHHKGTDHVALLFYHESQKTLLLKGDCRLLADGTFAYVPKMYKQLYIVHLFCIVVHFLFHSCFLLTDQNPYI